jgi:hypothetical protein
MQLLCQNRQGNKIKELCLPHRSLVYGFGRLAYDPVHGARDA